MKQFQTFFVYVERREIFTDHAEISAATLNGLNLLVGPYLKKMQKIPKLAYFIFGQSQNYFLHLETSSHFPNTRAFRRHQNTFATGVEGTQSLNK